MTIDWSTDRLQGRWRTLTEEFLSSAQGRALRDRVDAERAPVYPPRPFTAQELTPFDEVRVVIVGQDPYHGEGEAMGLAFSVGEHVKIPPSLRNIYKEIDAEYGVGMPRSGNLTPWARQGVLLMNTILSVRKDEAASHRGWGWETLTDRWLEALGKERKNLIVLLWGRFAQEKAKWFRNGHVILSANHPSPLSARRPPVPFLGCGHFRAVNDLLTARGEKPIDWWIEDESERSGRLF